MVEDCSSKKRPREAPSKVMKSSKESVKRVGKRNRDVKGASTTISDLS
jgi:hypothetical protein